MNHPEHGELIHKTLNTRHHDNVELIKCTRCGYMVDELEEFDDVDCDHYKSVKDGIMGKLGP